MTLCKLWCWIWSSYFGKETVVICGTQPNIF
uniref:Uncharacterized protein n=1 Tax=Arundo donax TaxID=35708 RepID=A0A0A8YIX0_ARUDO